MLSPSAAVGIPNLHVRPAQARMPCVVKDLTPQCFHGSFSDRINDYQEVFSYSGNGECEARISASSFLSTGIQHAFSFPQACALNVRVARLFMGEVLCGDLSAALRLL